MCMQLCSYSESMYICAMKGRKKQPYRILFVCLGNICRSPAAEVVCAAEARRRGEENLIELDSAGLYGGHAGELPDMRMREHAFVRGYRFTHRSRPVREMDFFDFDLIVAMDDRNVAALRSLAPTPEAQQKIVRMIDYVADKRGQFSVPDPYYEGAEGFELVLDMLEDGVKGLLDSVETKIKQ